MVILEYMLRMAAGGGAQAASDIKGFRRVSELGRGGMGAVFKVEEESSGKMFALKLMLADKNADAMARAKFLREASIGTQLVHDHIVSHYKYGANGDAFYILQEICEGGSVDKLMEKNGGKLPVDVATTITLQILDALVYAHGAHVETDLIDGRTEKFDGIVHRDIKPANYFIRNRTGPLVAKLADFGMAKAFEAAGLMDFTRTGEAGGTPVFMPRQQIMNYKYAKPDVDVWGVAASYYHMITGCFPKDFNFKKDPWSQALKNPAVPIRKRDRSVDKRLAEVIDHALLEKPAIGFGTALEFKRAIEGAI
jgi:serine/threonine-protein kinase